MWFYFIKQVTSGPPAKLKIIDIDLSEVRYLSVFVMLTKLTNQGQMLCLGSLSNFEWFQNIAK